MTARIVRPGLLRCHGRDVAIVGSGALRVSIISSTDEAEALRLMGEAVRVTIEPAQGPASPDADVDLAADLLDQLKRAIEEFEDQRFSFDDVIAELDAGRQLRRRVLSLANAAHNALLGAQRGRS